jgi:hypothetical protein
MTYISAMKQIVGVHIAVLIRFALACSNTGLAEPDGVRLSSDSVFPVPATIVSDCSADVARALEDFIAQVPDNATVRFPADAAMGQPSSARSFPRRNYHIPRPTHTCGLWEDQI